MLVLSFLMFSLSLGAAPLLKAKPVKDPNLQLVQRLATQADQIHREAWWVLTSERRPLEHSAFGKILRAASQQLEGKLAKKGVFNCDRYVFQLIKTDPWTAVFSEKCNDKAPENELATWTMTGPRSAEVMFVPAHLAEVLGLGASLFAKKFKCEMTWSESKVIDRLNCPDWEQERKNQILRLSNFEYVREGQALLKMKGQALENLVPVRKIETEVPVDGNIVVIETELEKPGAKGKPSPVPTTTTTNPGDGPVLQGAQDDGRPRPIIMPRRQFKPVTTSTVPGPPEEQIDGPQPSDAPGPQQVLPTAEPEYIPGSPSR